MVTKQYLIFIYRTLAKNFDSRMKEGFATFFEYLGVDLVKIKILSTLPIVILSFDRFVDPSRMETDGLFCGR